MKEIISEEIANRQNKINELKHLKERVNDSLKWKNLKFCIETHHCIGHLEMSFTKEKNKIPVSKEVMLSILDKMI